MKENILLTIIIPLYNVEQYITKALNSIKDQNILFEQYEVLIIDDGSTDNSSLIVKEWINNNKLNNFKYFSKQNGNWGSVINFAKDNKLIKGKYFSILDADDYLLSNCFYEFNNIVNLNYDLIIGNFYRLRNDKKINTKVIYSHKSGPIKQNRSFTAWSIPLCKFFKTEIFMNKINHLKEKVSYQDQILFHSFVLKSKSIYFIKNKIGVYFENRDGSSTSLVWNEFRTMVWCDNMNELLNFNNPQIAAYVAMMINYCYKNSEVKNKVLIDKKNIDILKKPKFDWLPFGLRTLTKLIFKILNRNVISNSKKSNY